MPSKKAGPKRNATPRDSEGPTQIDPPELTLSAPPPPPSPPSVLRFSEHEPISDRGTRDPEEWFTDILKGKEPWPDPEQQAVLAKWWGDHVGYDAAVIAVWMAERGLSSTTSTATIGTADLPPALESLQKGQVPEEATRTQAGTSLLTYERDAFGTLGPIVTDDKDVGTCVPLVAPRSVLASARGWMAGVSAAAFFFGGLMGWLGNGTETTVLAAPPVTSEVAPPSQGATPSQPASPSRSATGEPTPVSFARVTVDFRRPVSTYTLDVDTPLLVTRYEWSVTGPEQAECYSPAQFVWQPDNPVAVWTHPHDPVTHRPCAPGEDHSRSVVTVRAYFADGAGIVCRHQGAEATRPGLSDPCFPIQP